MTHAKPAAATATATKTSVDDPLKETVTERVQAQQQQLQEVPKAILVPETSSSATSSVILRSSTANSGE